MDRSPGDPTSTEPSSDLTLHDAAALYAVSARTLAQHIRCGQLPAYKTAGATAREWRVTREALEGAGYPPRQPDSAHDSPESPLVAQLRREVDAAKRAAAAQRRKAEATDRRLGLALLECGRLRTALAAATGTADASRQIDLDAVKAQQRVDVVTGAPTDQQPQHELG